MTDFVLIGALAGALAVAVAATVAAKRARVQLAAARELAELDSLTGLLNQRSFHEVLTHEVDRARRYERRLALVVVDVDNFKAINDQIGHLAGNAVLNEVARRLRAAVRATDHACRIGGDEFAVVLPESSSEDAQLLARRIADAVATPAVERAAGLTVSTGISELLDEDTANDLFDRADAGLYGAKGARLSRG